LLIRIITKKGDDTFPVKWSSPEVIKFGKFSVESDCWAFGIVLWELFSYGAIPYPGMSNTETIEKVTCGYCMDCPEDCPSEIYDLMLACWETEPVRRASFKHLFECIQLWQEKNAISSNNTPLALTIVLSNDIVTSANNHYTITNDYN